MAAFTLACPHCGTELEVQDEWTGMEMSCPSCQNDFVVPPGPEPVEATSQSAAYDVFCPHCGTELEVQDEWNGMEMTCPACQNTFTVPPRPAPAEAPVEVKPVKRTLSFRKKNPDPEPMHAISQPPQDAADPAMEEVPRPPKQKRKRKRKDETEDRDRPNWVKPVVKLVLCLILAGIGVYIYFKLTAPTPENLKGNQLYAMTQKRANPGGSAMGVEEIAKNDFFPIANSKEKFFYRDAQFIRVSVGNTKEAEVYSGSIYFRGATSKEQERPVKIDRSKTFTKYYFPVKYDEHPEHLEGDADLIFGLATQIDSSLKEWKFVSAKVTEKSTLACVISKDGTQKTIHLKVEIVVPEDNIPRVWVVILPEKGK